jgi:hypothetical protein
MRSANLICGKVDVMLMISDAYSTCAVHYFGVPDMEHQACRG